VLNMDYFERYIRQLFNDSSLLTLHTADITSGLITDTEQMSYITSMKDGSDNCLWEGWNYSVELDRATNTSKYNITFDDANTYEMKWYTGKSVVYKSFARPDAIMPRIAIFYSERSDRNFSGAGSTSVSVKSVKEISITLTIMNKSNGVYSNGGNKYYSRKAVDEIVRTIYDNLTSLGTGCSGADCTRTTNRPFPYPFIDINYVRTSDLSFMPGEDIWSRTMEFTGTYTYEI